MGRISRRVKETPSRLAQLLGFFVIVMLVVGFGVYAVAGMPIHNAEDLDRANIVALTSTGADAGISDVTAEDAKLSFTLNASAAILKLPFKDKWKDLKGTFTGIYVDLSDLENAAVWELAKVFISDGTTDIYVGSISADDEKAVLKVDPDDVEELDDLKTAYVIIKFYDAQGNLVDALSSGVTQEIEIYTTIKIDTSTVYGFFTTTALAIIAVIRKVINGIATAATGFLLAITTNSAILTVLGAVAVFIGLIYLSGQAKKGKIKVPW